MEALLLERMSKDLLQKRDSLTEWLHATPLGKKKVLLGPSTEKSVHARLDVIDDAISKADSRTLGKCEVCHEDVEPELLEVDYTACVCIEHLSNEERRHLESELELAQDVQKMLLPQEVPNIPGLEIAAYSRPAQIVGGDYFDFIDFSNGLHGLAIADVAGHGVSASLHMASIQALLQTLVPINKSPADVIRQIHKLFIHNIRFETFVTFFIGAFDSSTKTLTFCNAGHQPPLVLRNSKSKKESLEMLQPTGAAIGLVEESEFAEKTIELQKEDLLVLYTDGITEAVNLQNQEFGRERLETLIEQVERLPVKELIQKIRLSLEEFSEGKPLADDTTIVICKIR
ncbi:MAG: PP2C family protein-serine/threonine phosphatase [Deltaproteobacteria bacterium]|jgi:sigma-B regulation protein RsbU (phosphoserine phosphatase)|nr:PP2C family protein-serine/threonine phosphatase [Deltaproteobacteria bacterium]